MCFGLISCFSSDQFSHCCSNPYKYVSEPSSSSIAYLTFSPIGRLSLVLFSVPFLAKGLLTTSRVSLQGPISRVIYLHWCAAWLMSRQGWHGNSGSLRSLVSAHFYSFGITAIFCCYLY